jgi:hypothetical protein
MNCAITLFDMTTENQDYIFERLLGGLQTVQICENMLETTLGWRRDFYEEQLRKTKSKIQKTIEIWGRL